MQVYLHSFLISSIAGESEIHAPAALHLVKELTVFTEQEDKWAQEINSV